jgi:transcriptional regulator with XRE-family HTH domain
MGEWAMAFKIIREPEFAKRVKECRENIGLSQADCASDIGVSRQHWNNWEIGY